MTAADEAQTAVANAPGHFEVLVEAAIALAWSEAGTEARLLGEPDAERIFEAWPQMDDLLSALDEVRPGWREAGRP